MQEKSAKKSNFFHDRLRQLLELSPKTQKEIARELEMGESSIVYYKAGKGLPKSNELYRMSKYFGCSMEWLFMGEDDEGAPDLSNNAWKTRALIAEKRIEDLKTALQEAIFAVIKKF